MAINTLLDGVSSTGAGSSIGTVRGRGRSDLIGVVQAIVGDTATVKLQGSLDDSNWFDIVTFTATDGASFDVPTYLRGNVTSHSSGTVTLKVDI